MRHWLLLIISILVLCSSVVNAQGDQTAAKDFGLSLIQSLYDNQCSYVFDHLDKTVFSIQGGQSIVIENNMRALFCKDSPIRRDISNSYSKYLNQYSPQIYDHKTFKKQFPTWAKHITLKAGDYFFDGANPKATGYTRLFTSENQVRFVLRYAQKNWVIIGI